MWLFILTATGAGQYRWSSYRAKLGLAEATWLDSDPCFDSLGNTDVKRRVGYRTFVEDRVAAIAAHQFIQTALDRAQLTGNSLFIDEIENRTVLRIESRGPGGPLKTRN